MNSVQPDMTYSKEPQPKMKILEKLILKDIWMKQFQWNTVSWLYLGGAIVFLWVLKGATPRKES